MTGPDSLRRDESKIEQVVNRHRGPVDSNLGHVEPQI